MKESNKDITNWFKEKWVAHKKLQEGNLHKWFKGSKDKSGKPGWVNVVTGDSCASDKPGEGVPKCVSSSKRASMTPAQRRSAAARKRAADPGQQSKSGAAKPTYVPTDKKKKKKINEQFISEQDKKGKGSGKKDACYHKVKARFKVWPSAYASGALVRCRKVGAANWGNKSETNESLLKAGVGASVASALIGFGAAQMKNQQAHAIPSQPTPAEIQPEHEDFTSVPAPQQEQPKKKVYHHDVIKKMVIEDEGIKTEPYKDTRGILTVGIGHNLETPNSRATFAKAFGEQGHDLHRKVKSGQSITHEQAMKLFDADYDEHLSRAIKFIPNLHEHPPEVQAVLVSGTYRGHVGDAPAFRRMFNSGDIAGASAEVLNRKEYKNPAKDKKGKIKAPGVITRLERDSKVLADYAKTK